MSLKVFTTTCMIAGLLLFFSWPSMLANHPGPGSSKAVRRTYADRLLLLTGLQVLTLVGAGVGAALVFRNARSEYRAEALSNMKFLLEGDREDASKVEE
ncbi:MAG TPA: hypothetical protein VG944_05690 [Fimbriimonas sp.]|nr:hypothetical protein [Fimbriimonas sp.]